jgi:outer membrane protein assembly factor BamA
MDVYKSWFKLPPQSKNPHPENKVYFTLNPLANAPTSSGNALVTSTTANVYLGPQSTTFLSTATFAPYFNFNKRFGLPLRSNIWLKDNSWNIQGDIRFLVYPQYTWGLGTSNTNQGKEWVNYKYIRFYQTVLKRVKPHLFVGLGYDLDYHFNIGSDTGVNLIKFTGYPYGLYGNSLSSGITFNLLYDTRNRNIYPFPGTFLNIVYRLNPGFLGNVHPWQSVFVDVRKYLQLNTGTKPNQQNTLAFWSFLWLNSNTGTPYLDLPSTGWDEYNRSSRGFDQNRYRGNALYYFETEYRRDITKNGLFGLVLFSNINTVSGSGTMFQSWHPAGGAGLRIKFSKASNTNFAIDYAFSKGYRTVLFNFSETF